MFTDRAGAVTEVWGHEAQSPAQITHEKADGVLEVLLEKSLRNVHTLTDNPTVCVGLSMSL